MKARVRQHWQMTLALLLALFPASVPAASLGELQTSGRLEISAELIPAMEIVVGQRVELVITIATNRWFAGGTRLEIPEVSGLVLLQTNEFASNASENRRGQSWVVQRWSLDVYPQRSGSFTVPPITARLTVSDEISGNVNGELQSPAVKFQARVPSALAQVRHWVAAPSYKVSQNFDKDLEQLKVGDAFEREIIFEATAFMAMMLPTFTPKELPGLATYPQPVSLTDNANRGSLVARRVEHITYVVEQQGSYQLPARDYYWWDTRKGELEMRFLPAVDIQVGKGTGVKNKEHESTKLANIDPRKLLIYLGFGAAVIGLAWLLYTHLPRLPPMRLSAPIKRTWQRLIQMRQPALPATLNPDGNAGE